MLIDMSFETKEQGLEKLKKGVEMRNRMGGSLFWNIVNDDCIEIANKLLYMGVESSELNTILHS